MHKLIERLLVFTLAACGIAACCIGIVERCGFWPDESESMVGE